MQNFRYEKARSVKNGEANPRAVLLRQARALKELIDGLLNDCTGRDTDELSASLELAQDVLLDSSFIAKCSDCGNYMRESEITNCVCELCDGERRAENPQPFVVYLVEAMREQVK